MNSPGDIQQWAGFRMDSSVAWTGAGILERTANGQTDRQTDTAMNPT